jgi:hypothetical protein
MTDSMNGPVSVALASPIQKCRDPTAYYQGSKTPGAAIRLSGAR